MGQPWHLRVLPSSAILDYLLYSCKQIHREHEVEHGIHREHRRKGWITAYPVQGCRNQENVMHCAHFVRGVSGQPLTPRSVF